MKKFLVSGIVVLLIFIGIGAVAYGYLKLTEKAAEVESVAPVANRSDDTIVLGVDTDSPPLRFYDNNKQLVGFDVDFLDAAFKIMGKKYELHPMAWSEKTELLNNKEIDLIWGGLTITEKRKKIYLMTKPYIEASILVVVAADSDIHTLEDLAGKRIGHQKGSFTKTLLGEFSEKNPKGALAGLTAFTSVPASMSSILTGKIDASVSSSASVLYYVANSEGRFRILTQPLQKNEGLSIGGRLEDTQLVGEVNNAIDQLYANGKMAEFKSRWFGQ